MSLLEQMNGEILLGNMQLLAYLFTYIVHPYMISDFFVSFLTPKPL